MSYDPADEMDAYSEYDGPVDPLEAEYGGNMVSAVNDVIVNIFNERWEDDELVKAFEVLCEAYTTSGAHWSDVKAYANDNTPGYYFPGIDSVTRESLTIAGLIDPVDH